MCFPHIFYFCAIFPWHSARISTSVMSRGFMRPSNPLGFYADLNRKPTQGNALSVCRPNSQDAFTTVPWLEQNKSRAQHTFTWGGHLCLPILLSQWEQDLLLTDLGLSLCRWPRYWRRRPLPLDLSQSSKLCFSSPVQTQSGEARLRAHSSLIISACCILLPEDSWGLQTWDSRSYSVSLACYSIAHCDNHLTWRNPPSFSVSSTPRLWPNFRFLYSQSIPPTSLCPAMAFLNLCNSPWKIWNLRKETGL